MLEVVDVYFATRLEHNVQHAKRAEYLDSWTIAYDIQYRWSYEYSCQDESHDAWYVYLSTHERHEPNNANHKGEYQKW